MICKICSKCGVVVPYGKRYCDDCFSIIEEQKRERKLKYDKKYNKTRDSKYLKFYSSIEWRTLSSRYTQEKLYRCEECNAIANQVHHIKPIQTDAGWDERLEWNNLELLCTKCHNKRHNRFIKKK